MLGGGRPLRDREQRGVRMLGLQAERGDPAGDLALVEPVALEVVEQVPREAELGGRDGESARELEGQRRAAVVEDSRSSSASGFPSRATFSTAPPP